MRKLFFPLLCLALMASSLKVHAQQQESYTFVTGSSYAYLFDTNATSTSTFFKRWTIGTTRYTAHLYKDTIYQTYGSSMIPGGYGQIRKIDWNGTVVWSYTITNAHHDICPMPNGNVLCFVRETKTAAQVQAAGGNTNQNISFDIIREVRPTGATTGTVVWEWRLWDHLCQSTNASKPNYVTSISQNPHRWNINCNLTPDGFHPNGLDYNPELDQIVFSSHNQDEIFVIDHSTTTAQAATSNGGNSGRGGDFIWRWGKPQNYGCTSNGNGITLNVIHDARWVPATNTKWPDYISFYHNNSGGAVQCVLHLPDYNGYTYNYTPGSVIGTNTPVLPAVPSITNVNSMGGCMVCDNGNVVITRPNSFFRETDGVSSTALQSVTVATVQADRLKLCNVRYPEVAASISASAVCVNIPINMGSAAISITETNPAFTYSWSSVPAGFSSSLQNPVVTPTAPGTYQYTVLVTNNVGCTDTASVYLTVDACTAADEIASAKPAVSIYPNPGSGIFHLSEDFVQTNDFDLLVYDVYGRLILQDANCRQVDISAYADGIYHFVIQTQNHNIVREKMLLMR